jgi:hypothetical protein
MNNALFHMIFDDVQLILFLQRKSLRNADVGHLALIIVFKANELGFLEYH